MPVHSRSPIFPGNGGFSAPLSSVRARDLRRRSGLLHARRLQGDRRPVAGPHARRSARGRQAAGQPLPDACGTVAIGAQPSDANRAQAEELTRRAYDAEMQGDVQEARTLLRRASDLDATNKSAAYHLGLTSETLGDRTAAVTAYCRYPLARADVDRGGRGAPARGEAVAGDDAGSGGERQRARRERSACAGRDHAARDARSARGQSRGSSPARARAGADESRRAGARRWSSRAKPMARRGGAAVEDEVVAASRPEPPVEQPPAAPPTVRRGPSRAQSAGIGAAAGAIIGAATGRSVKSAIIGAAAGGIFGTAVGGTTRPLQWPHLIVGDRCTTRGLALIKCEASRPLRLTHPMFSPPAPGSRPAPR